VDIQDILYTASIWVLPVLFAITFHEAAHGFVAWRLGDDTAKRQGRVTFNPLRHIDLFGTVLLPALLLIVRAPFLFGYAKPVPVDFSRLRQPVRDMVWVAAAGPGINLVLAVAAALLFHLTVFAPEGTGDWLRANLENALIINVLLAVFNMVPLPPLDGGRVAVGLLPRALAIRLARLERWGLMIVVAALFILPMAGARLGVELNVFRWLVGVPAKFLIENILFVTGH